MNNRVYVVRHEGRATAGHRVFEGAFARSRAGEYARVMGMALAGEPCLLTIADPARWDRHREGPLVLASYLWVPGSGWQHQRGTVIRGLEQAAMAQAAE